jgi:hypothetical protein
MENFLLKVFRLLVTFLLLAAMVSFFVLLIKAGNNYMQTPNEPRPAEVAKLREIKFEDMLRYLEEKEKQKKEGGAQKKQLTENFFSLKYQEEATVLFRCAADFGRLVGNEIESVNNQENADRLQNIRIRLERLASGSSLHGDLWVKSLTSFICNGLKDTRVIELKNQNKEIQIFFPMLDFYHEAWGLSQREKLEFDNAEIARVTKERAVESARILAAKASAYLQLSLAGGALGAFMLLALYLIMSKIERNLMAIEKAIRKTE